MLHRSSPQLSRGRPPRVAECDDASVLALGSQLASPSNLAAVASEGRSPMTVAGPRRIRTGFLRRHRLTVEVSHTVSSAAANRQRVTCSCGRPRMCTSWTPLQVQQHRNPRSPTEDLTAQVSPPSATHTAAATVWCDSAGMPLDSSPHGPREQRRTTARLYPRLHRGVRNVVAVANDSM
jgi:hypothetical protein